VFTKKQQDQKRSPALMLLKKGMVGVVLADVARRAFVYL
jgi:hypothetical protein